MRLDYADRGNVISLRDLHNACLLVDFLQSIDSVFYKLMYID